MATLSFQVHTDKENETPYLRSIDKSKGLKSFSKSSKLTQATPRKALGSVNQQLPPLSQGVGGKGFNVSQGQGPVEALFKSKNSIVDENSQVVHFAKKPKAKRSPVVHTGLKKPTATKHISKTRTPKSKQPKLACEPIPNIPDDLEYDSDTIFPHADRLSHYVDKLLTWRPPCLFGTIPDSDSDTSHVEEDLNQIITIDEIPVDLCEVDDSELPVDLSELLVDLPPVSPSDNYAASQNNSCDLFNEQSLDSSLHLGSLHLDMSNLECGDLGLGAHGFS